MKYKNTIIYWYCCYFKKRTYLFINQYKLHQQYVKDLETTKNHEYVEDTEHEWNCEAAQQQSLNNNDQWNIFYPSLMSMVPANIRLRMICTHYGVLTFLQLSVQVMQKQIYY